MNSTKIPLHATEQVLIAVPYPRTDDVTWGVTCPTHFDYSPTDRERCCAEAFAEALACGKTGDSQ